jgi:hypothetical protein
MDNKTVPGILMCLLSFACIYLVLLGLLKGLERTDWTAKKKNNFFIRTLIGVSIWVIGMSALALSGFFKDFAPMPPRIVFILVLAIPILIVIANSKSFTDLLRVTPPHWLVFMQSFRIVVEILLFIAYGRQLLPVQMTFEGYNYDILSGLLAIPAGWLMMKYPYKARSIGLIYNTLGILLLINILTIAVLSMPTQIRYFTNDPANTIVGEFPFIYLPAILVITALALHIFSIRQLLLKGSLAKGSEEQMNTVLMAK